MEKLGLFGLGERVGWREIEVALGASREAGAHGVITPTLVAVLVCFGLVF